MAALMDRDSGPVLAPVPGVDLEGYKCSLVLRFTNPAIRDTVARVNRDAPLNVLIDPIREARRAGRSVPLLALGLAAWLRRVRGENEAGQFISVEHPMADELRRRAIDGGADPVPLLSLRSLFGNFVDDARLVEQVGRWLASLYRVGAGRTIACAVASSSPLP